MRSEAAIADDLERIKSAAQEVIEVADAAMAWIHAKAEASDEIQVTDEMRIEGRIILANWDTKSTGDPLAAVYRAMRRLAPEAPAQQAIEAEDEQNDATKTERPALFGGMLSAEQMRRIEETP